MAASYYARLANGRRVWDSLFDPTLIPSSAQKDALDNASGTPGSGNPFILDDDSRLTDARTPTTHNNTYHSETYITAAGVTYGNLDTNGDVGTVADTVAAGDDSRFPTSDEKAALDAAPNSLTAANPVADKQYVDALVSGLDWQESIQHNVQYIKTDAGAPSGTGTSGEKCLNTNEAKLYTYTSSWDAGVAVSTGDRFINKDDGSDTTGNSGTYTADDKIREYNGSTFDETTPTEGTAAWVEDEDSLYMYNGSAWVQFGSTTVHNNTSGKQGGTTGEFYHLTQDEHDAVNGATTPSSSNVVQTALDRDKLPVPYTFTYQAPTVGFPQSQTDTEIYDRDGIFQQVLLPSAGSIVKTTLQSTGARTAGALTAEPSINGTKVTANDLDLTLDGSTTNDAKAEVAPGTTNLTFSAGDKIGVMFTSDASWANATGDLVFTAYVVFDT